MSYEENRPQSSSGRNTHDALFGQGVCRMLFIKSIFIITERC
jgi:hypothetical protein